LLLGEGHWPGQMALLGPAAIAVEGHGQAAFLTGLSVWAGSACTLDAHDAGFPARAYDSVGLDHGVVLLVDPALGADIRAGEELFEVRCVVAVFGKLGGNFIGRF